MQVFINGKSFTSAHTCLADVLEQWGVQPPFAIALNKQFIPRHQLALTAVQANDAIDIVVPISGG